MIAVSDTSWRMQAVSDTRWRTFAVADTRWRMIAVSDSRWRTLVEHQRKVVKGQESDSTCKALIMGQITTTVTGPGQYFAYKRC